ncbi:hypothetical protein ABIA35_005139 [Catenulispora sp. MAP12-49]
MARQTVAEQYVDLLARAGVRRIYGVVGDSLNPVVDAVRRHGEVEWVQVRHEEVAAFAAGAEAQLTGRLAACAGSCGPPRSRGRVAQPERVEGGHPRRSHPDPADPGRPEVTAPADPKP